MYRGCFQDTTIYGLGSSLSLLDIICVKLLDWLKYISVCSYTMLFSNHTDIGGTPVPLNCWSLLFLFTEIVPVQLIFCRCLWIHLKVTLLSTQIVQLSSTDFSSEGCSCKVG